MYGLRAMMLPASMICLTSSGASSGGRATPLGSAGAFVMSVEPAGPGRGAAAGGAVAGRAGRGGPLGLGADFGQSRVGRGRRARAAVAGDRLDDLGPHLRE